MRDYGVSAIVAMVIAAAALIGPALYRPMTRVAGFRSDPAAEVWSLHQLSSGRLGLIEPTTTPMINAPDGARLRRPVEITTAFVDVLAWPIYHVASPVTTRNLLLVLGAIGNGIALLVAAATMRLRRVPAVIGAIAFMYAPSLVTETRLHMALVFAFPIPLAFAAGV